MDQRLIKALEASKNLESLNRQKKYAFEKYQESITVYHNGGLFTAGVELIREIGLYLSKDIETAIFIDNENIPIEIENLQNFYHKVWDIYIRALQEYKTEYNDIISILRNNSV
jgi:hypothetical protein